MALTQLAQATDAQVKLMNNMNDSKIQEEQQQDGRISMCSGNNGYRKAKLRVFKQEKPPSLHRSGSTLLREGRP